MLATQEQNAFCILPTWNFKQMNLLSAQPKMLLYALLMNQAKGKSFRSSIPATHEAHPPTAAVI
eukprot:scaffold28764_cov83-Skeletonema_dohrnii-CCMP3373.AAC.2